MHDSSQNDEIAQEVSCDSLDENMSINNSSLSTSFTTAGREKELLTPILVFPDIVLQELTFYVLYVFCYTLYLV